MESTDADVFNEKKTARMSSNDFIGRNIGYEAEECYQLMAVHPAGLLHWKAER